MAYSMAQHECYSESRLAVAYNRKRIDGDISQITLSNFIIRSDGEGGSLVWEDKYFMNHLRIAMASAGWSPDGPQICDITGVVISDSDQWEFSMVGTPLDRI